MSAREILFGKDLRPVSIGALAKRTKIAERTLYDWRDDPQRIPLGKLRKLCRELDLTDEDIVKLVRGMK